jgi:phosphoribosylpyrophosphate synthetase
MPVGGLRLRASRRWWPSGRMVAEVLEAVGIDHVVTMDLHAPQIEGFFHIPVDGLTAVPTLCNALRGLSWSRRTRAPFAWRLTMRTT